MIPELYTSNRWILRYVNGISKKAIKKKKKDYIVYNSTQTT